MPSGGVHPISFIAPLLVTAAVGLVFGCGGIGLIIKDMRRIGGDDDPEIAITAADALAPGSRAHA